MCAVSTLTTATLCSWSWRRYWRESFFLVTQPCLTLCNTVDSSPPGSSVHGILQARKLEWVAITSSRGSSQPRDQTCTFCDSCIGRLILHHWATWEAQILGTFHYVGMIDEITGHWWLNSLLSPSPLPGRLGFGAESSKHLIKSWPFRPPLSWSFLQVPSPVISLAHKRCSSL